MDVGKQTRGFLKETGKNFKRKKTADQTDEKPRGKPLPTSGKGTGLADVQKIEAFEKKRKGRNDSRAAEKGTVGDRKQQLERYVDRC